MKKWQNSSTPDASFRDRLKASIIGWTGWAAIVLIGRTIRWSSIGDSHIEDVHRSGKQIIYTIWHGRMFPAAWHWRGRNIVMLASLNRDGDAMARCIAHLGFGSARGSSSRGGARALVEMAHAIREGHDVGFTVDGPRGPRHVAKPGPVLLAKKTGSPIVCTHLSLRKKIELKSWDRFQIPAPFTEAVVLKAPPLWVPQDADETRLAELQIRLQQTMDELQAKGDAWWNTVGGGL